MDDAPVPSSPANRRRRAKAPAAQQQVQLQKDEPRQRRARNVAFNRRELDNAIGSNSGTKQKRARGNDLGSNSNKYVRHLRYIQFFHTSFHSRRPKRG